MTRSGRATAALVVLIAAACARPPVPPSAPVTTPQPPPADLYVLLPGRDGAVGTITVSHDSDRQVLADPYAAVRITSAGRLEPGRVTAQEVRAVFGPALDAQPPPAASFILYFLFGTDQLTTESSRALADVLAEVRRRPDPEVIIIGHTDRVGGLAQNDVLSAQRAERVRQEVLGLGIAPDRIQTVGRGEREPLVPTEDKVPEPRNRRVEITVR